MHCICDSEINIVFGGEYVHCRLLENKFVLDPSMCSGLSNFPISKDIDIQVYLERHGQVLADKAPQATVGAGKV